MLSYLGQHLPKLAFLKVFWDEICAFSSLSRLKTRFELGWYTVEPLKQRYDIVNINKVNYSLILLKRLKLQLENQHSDYE